MYPLIGLRRHGEKRVRDHIENAILTHPILVCSPLTKHRYLPPILLDPKKLTRKIVRDTRNMMYSTLLFLVVGSVISYFAVGWSFTVSFTFVFLSLFIYTVFDYLSFSASQDNLEQRWLYYGWCFSKPPVIAGSFLAVMALIGGIQVAAMMLGASHDTVRETLGLAYYRVTDHNEWWRILTGPYLHNSLAHWLTNTLIGAGLLLLYGPVLGAVRCWVVIIAAAPVSFLAVYVCSTYWSLDGEGIVGLSGGIAGVIGYFLAANLRDKPSFPPHFYFVTIFVATSSLLVVSFVTSTTSFIAHLAGFIAGILFGIISNPIHSSFYIEASDSES
jgi:membrane associated rhomboid family serine protease